MRLALGLIIGLTLGGVAVTQQEKPAPAAAAAAPLTELEQLQLEHLKLRSIVAQLQVNLDACQAEKGDAHRELGQFRAALASAELTEDEAALKKAIEAARPGYDFNPKTRALTPKPPADGK